MSAHDIAGFGGTILQSPLFINLILPFLLIFAVVFAILQKTKILGEGKRQIDAIVALVIGLMVVAFAQAVDIIVFLMPVLGVSIVVVLVFMILFGSVFKEGEFKMHTGIKWIVGILAVIVIAITLLVLTGWWDYLIDLVLYQGEGSSLVTNIVFIVIVIVAIAAVVFGGGGGGGKKSSDSAGAAEKKE